MKNHNNFIGRVKFTLRDPEGDAESDRVYAKMVELFHAKHKTGSLRYWLLDLAYQSAARELLVDEGQGMAVGTITPVHQAAQKNPQPPAQQQAVKSEPELKTKAKAKAEHAREGEPQAQVGQVRERAVESTRSRVEQGAVTVGGDVGGDVEIDDDDVDMDSFLPLTLSGSVEKERGKQGTGKGSDMPLGISGLVMST